MDDADSSFDKAVYQPVQGILDLVKSLKGPALSVTSLVGTPKSSRRE